MVELIKDLVELITSIIGLANLIIEHKASKSRKNED